MEGASASRPIVRPLRVDSAALVLVRPPHPFLVLAEGWPGALVPILALGCPIAGAFFPAKYHPYFNLPSNPTQPSWYPTSSYSSSTVQGRPITFMSGSLGFLKTHWPSVARGGQAILVVEIPKRGATVAVVRRVWQEAQRFLESVGLSVVSFSDDVCGGPLDAKFLFGFGRHLGGKRCPAPLPTVARCVRDYVDGGVDGWEPRIPLDSVEQREDSVRHALRGTEGTYRIEGLLPTFNPAARFLCPTYYSKTELVVRRLSPGEILRMYQLPSSMDTHFGAGLNVTKRMPFEDSPSPVIYASILRQIWGVDEVGGSISEVSAAAQPPNLEDLEESARPTPALALPTPLASSAIADLEKALETSTRPSPTPASPSLLAPNVVAESEEPVAATSNAVAEVAKREALSECKVESTQLRTGNSSCSTTQPSLLSASSASSLSTAPTPPASASPFWEGVSGASSCLGGEGDEVAVEGGPPSCGPDAGAAEMEVPGKPLKGRLEPVWLPDALAANSGSGEASMVGERVALEETASVERGSGTLGGGAFEFGLPPVLGGTLDRRECQELRPVEASAPSMSAPVDQDRSTTSATSRASGSTISSAVPGLHPRSVVWSTTQGEDTTPTLDPQYDLLSLPTLPGERAAYEELDASSLGSHCHANSVWQFTFDEGVPAPFGGSSVPSLLTDDSTLTSEASELTLKTRGRGATAKGEEALNKFGLPGDLEPHEIGPPLKRNPGPPFRVGDVLHCEIAARAYIQNGVILEADDPRYLIKLDDDTMVDTSKELVYLVPHPAPGQLAPHPSIAHFEEDIRKLGDQVGSLGVHLDAQEASLQRVREEKEYAKAVKADDAKVPVHLWNRRIKFARPEAVRDQQFERLRKLGHRLFVRALYADCIAHLVAEHGEDWVSQPKRVAGKLTELGRDQQAIANLLYHADNTNWFEYKAGSRLIYFRFPLRYRKLARDGVPIFFEKAGPTTQDPQPTFNDPKVRQAVRGKIDKVLKRRYMLRTGYRMKSLIKYFAVPKGEDDVRLVYDATANQLNDCVWAPSFWLPTIDTLIRALDEDSWMADRDVGEMFLNFQLHPSAIPFTGVDLGPIYEDQDENARWACWDRNLMGFGPSPYNSIKMSLIAEEICKGDRHDPSNPFQWKAVRLNLPGSPGYDPSITWVSKLRDDGRIACDIFTFVDDERVTGPTEKLAWDAAHTMAAKQSYLGMQDAGRKVRPGSQTPGAWAGAVVHVVRELGVCALTSEDKWAKLKAILTKWKERLDGGETQLNHKELLSDRGFLVYVTRNYPAMVPYLKGFHLSVEMWRGNRDAEGWKLKPTADDSSLASAQSLTSIDITRAGGYGMDLNHHSSYRPGVDEDEDAAAYLQRAEKKAGELRHVPESGSTPVVPRLADDLAALLRLTDFEKPPLRVVRSSNVVQVFYGFGDAAGKGFGSTVAGAYDCEGQLSPSRKLPSGVNYRVGLWSAVEREESSNYKELCNLVETAEAEAMAGRLRDSEFFLFTDNSTAESCFYRGSSKSKKLHGLVIRLRLLEIKFNVIVHLIHVSGERMIAQGTDGCSRGYLMEGVMAGEDMLSFVDLAKTAIERHPPLLDWIKSWTQLDVLEPLSPEDWYEKGHGIIGGSVDGRGVWIPKHEPKGRLHLWVPPPAAADAALEELLKARHKRSDTYHVVAIPRLVTPRWRRLFNKACDFTFVVPTGTSFWPSNMFEPLWVGVVLPFSHHRPWCLKRAPLLVEMGITLRGLLQASDTSARDLLRKLLRIPRRLDKVSGRVARGLLHMPGEGDFPYERDAGHGAEPLAQRGGAPAPP